MKLYLPAILLAAPCVRHKGKPLRTSFHRLQIRLRLQARFQKRPLRVLAGVALTLAASSAGAQTVAGLDYIGQTIFNTNTFYNGTQVGGLSGLNYDRANNVFTTAFPMTAAR